MQCLRLASNIFRTKKLFIPKLWFSQESGSSNSQSTNSQKPEQGTKIWPKAVAIMAGCVIVGIAIGGRYHSQRVKEVKQTMEQSRSYGSTLIGGSFNLIDHTGKAVTLSDFKGKWLLFYFGFCHCPDICPDQLDKMIDVVLRIELKPNVLPLVPIFVTVDPQRDTPEVVANYIKDFSYKIVGLTGTEENVKAICKAYRIYYSAGPKDQDGDYIVDHAIIMYLIGPNGEFIDYYGQNKTSAEIADGIANHMKAKQLN